MEEPARWHGHLRSDWDATKELAREILRRQAALPSPTISYSALAARLAPVRFEPDDHGFHAMLGEISTEEDDEGHGMLSVLVVHKTGDLQPGPGFFQLAASRGRDICDPMKVWIDEFNAVTTFWRGRSLEG